MNVAQNIKTVLLSIATFVSMEAATAQVFPTDLLSNVDAKKMELWVDSVLNTMSIDERIGQLFFPIVDPAVSPSNKELLRKLVTEVKIGGILFSKGKPEQQAELTNYTLQLAKLPLMVTLDGEWGLAMRLEGTTRFPRNMMLGAVASDSLIYAYGVEVGKQCRAMGIHVNFAPVLDLNSNPRNPVIGTRSFGEEKEHVANKAIAYAKGLESQRVIAVGKHFPGHGDTAEDSHFTLPLLKHDATRMYDYEIYPFRKFIEAGLSGILTAHLAIPSLDKRSDRPSSLSPIIVTQILKKELGFEGLVFTDGLAMKGVTRDADHCLLALLAGNDVLLGPINTIAQFDRVKQAFAKGRLTSAQIDEKCKKILRYKFALGIHKQQPIQTNNLAQQYNSRSAQQLNRVLHAEAITLLKDDSNLLPLQRLDQKQISVVSVGAISRNSFLNTMEKYQAQTQFVMSANSSKEVQDKILRDTRSANLLILGVHSNKEAELSFIRRLCEGRNYVLVIFQSPYRMSSMKSLIANASGVILAYEDSELAQEFAAQLIYGGIEAKGSLSVSVPGIFEVGAGIKRPQTRLGYVMPEQASMDYAKLLKIDQIIEEGIAEQAFPGCQVLVAKNGNIVYQKSFGYFDYSNNRKVEDNDIYDLASITKVAATVPALMKVRDTHQVLTNHKLGRYIPELRATDKDQITIRSALFHESGLQAGYPFYRMAIELDSLNAPLMKGVKDANYSLQIDQKMWVHKDYRFKPEIVSPSKGDHFSIQVSNTIFLNNSFSDSILWKINSLPLKNKGRYNYSCLNFVLLRKAVENITQKSFDSFLTEQFYAPLGASTMTFNPLDRLDHTQIAPTENDFFLRKQLLKGLVHDELAAFSGGVEGNAGLFSNSGDLAKLLQMMLNEGEYGGERFITSETARLFTTTKSAKSRRGLGFDKPNTTNPNNSPTCVQASALTYGHTGFTGTSFWVDPENNLVYIFLTNRVYPHRWNKKLMSGNYRTRIQSAIYDSIL